jgi:hypothetical protein
MLQNLAASIRSALGSSDPAEQQQQHRQTAAAAADDSDAEDMELDNLRWRPQTGLQLPARAARVVAAAAAGSQQQQQLTAAGPQVHNPAVAAAAEGEQDGAAAAAPAAEGPAVAAATKPKGLSKQLPAAAAATSVTASKQQRGKKGSAKGDRAAAAAAAGPEGANRKWYQLPAVEITDDVKRDLRLLRLRGAYDPKRFYKSFDETKFPKHFAVSQCGMSSLYLPCRFFIARAAVACWCVQELPAVQAARDSHAACLHKLFQSFVILCWCWATAACLLLLAAAAAVADWHCR